LWSCIRVATDIASINEVRSVEEYGEVGVNPKTERAG
jgi:hypothetical protein